MQALSLPIWPAILRPLKILPGCSHIPIEPGALCVLETPWDAFYIWKFQRFMVPCIPLPLLVEMQSTHCPILKCLGPKQYPTGKKFSFATGNSAKWRLGGKLYLIKCPICGFFIFYGSTSPTPTCIASTPSFSKVLTCVI